MGILYTKESAFPVPHIRYYPCNKHQRRAHNSSSVNDPFRQEKAVILYHGLNFIENTDFSMHMTVLLWSTRKS